jgi:transposase
MKITTVGIDLAKNVFQIHGVDDHGKPVLRKKLGMVQKARILVNSRRAESSPAYKVCGPAFVL